MMQINCFFFSLRTSHSIFCVRPLIKKNKYSVKSSFKILWYYSKANISFFKTIYDKKLDPI